jgi:sialate O-acetylesterase
MPLNAVQQNNQIIISFQYADGLKTSDGNTLRGFKLVNEKGEQQEVKAFIQKNKVIIPTNKNENAKEVLYGWQPYTDANLMNTENLPASTFKITIQ